MTISENAKKLVRWIKKNPIEVVEWFKNGEPASGSASTWNQVKINDQNLVSRNDWMELVTNGILVPSRNEEILYEIDFSKLY